MERHEAWQHFTGAKSQLEHCLEQIEDVDSSWTLHVIALDQALAELHEAVSSFQDGDAIEEHEEVYGPLFDALSYVSTARHRCKGKGLRTELVRVSKLDVQHARDVLDEAFAAAIPH